MAKILLVEDDPELAERLRDWFGLENHVVELIDNGEDALQMLENYTFDVIILDWGLPGILGPEVCQRYRKSGGVTPILFLTGKGDVLSRVAGLDLGADDYVSKPFDVKELSARVRSLVRRPPQFAAPDLSVGEVLLHVGSRTVNVGELSVQLMRKECAILEYLMRHPDRHYSAKQLLESVWPSDTEASEDTVRTCIKTLRRQLGALGKRDYIKTELGSGYYVQTQSTLNSSEKT